MVGISSDAIIIMQRIIISYHRLVSCVCVLCLEWKWAGTICLMTTALLLRSALNFNFTFLSPTKSHFLQDNRIGTILHCARLSRMKYFNLKQTVLLFSIVRNLAVCFLLYEMWAGILYICILDTFIHIPFHPSIPYSIIYLYISLTYLGYSDLSITF